MNASTQLSFAALLSTLLACSATVSQDGSEPSAGTDDTATNSAASSTSTTRRPAKSDEVPAANSVDDDESPAPPPVAPDGKRNCGLNGTEPRPLTTRAVWLTSLPFKYGAGVVNGKPIGTLWASGTPTGIAGATGSVRTGASGADLDLLNPVSAWVVPGSNLYLTGSGFAGTAWASQYAPSKTKLTYSIREEMTTAHFSIDEPKKTSATPADDNAEFIRGASARSLFAATIVFDFPNTCAVDAVSALIGREAFVGNGPGNPGGILGSENAEALQKSLIENKVSVTIAVLGTTKLAGVSAALNASACSTANLKGCTDTFKAVSDAYYAARKARGDKLDAAAFAAGTDPFFTTAVFSTADVGIL